MDLPSRDWFVDPEYWRTNRSFIWNRARLERSRQAMKEAAGLLGMKDGEKVLDLACGFGRHSLPLAKMGFSVTGVDLNSDFIREAGDQAGSSGLNAEFICADMRDFVRPEGFDHVLIMYNSLGYFEDPSDDARVLDNCFASLRPGGSLLVQTITRERIMSARPSRVFKWWFEEDDGRLRLEEARADEHWSWNTTRWILINGGRREEYIYRVRIRSTEEYRQLLRDAGFTYLAEYGSLAGKSYSSREDHLILVGRKPE